MQHSFDVVEVNSRSFLLEMTRSGYTGTYDILMVHDMFTKLLLRQGIFVMGREEQAVVAEMSTWLMSNSLETVKVTEL